MTETKTLKKKKTVVLYDWYLPAGLLVTASEEHVSAFAGAKKLDDTRREIEVDDE